MAGQTQIDSTKTRQRLKDDLQFYGRNCLKIRTKSGEIASFVINKAQAALHARLEQQRKRTGKVRALVLKGRQQGCSTYVQARYFHRVTHGFGLKAFILTHEQEATKNIFEIANRYHENCPDAVKPMSDAVNAKELAFGKLDSGYRVSTAGTKNTGRSLTIQFFHGSEVAFWPNAETHIAGAMQAVPDEPGTEIILESTSAGPDGMFYDMWNDAEKGIGEYEAVFIPWFIQEEYRAKPPSKFKLSDDETVYKEKYKLTLEQMAWRRNKILELRGIWNFRREYPAEPEEAFAAENPSALWTRDIIKLGRTDVAPVMQRIVIAIDPAVSTGKSSAKTAIYAVGIDDRWHGYVLANRTIRAKPAVWAARAISLFHEFKADRVIGEVNNGGDMIESTLRTEDPNISYSSVHASKGKHTRAEPIAALYEQGKCHHVGEFPDLEDQQCNWVPGTLPSPDDMDAVVWGFTELFGHTAIVIDASDDALITNNPLLGM